MAIFLKSYLYNFLTSICFKVTVEEKFHLKKDAHKFERVGHNLYVKTKKKKKVKWSSASNISFCKNKQYLLVSFCD